MQPKTSLFEMFLWRTLRFVSNYDMQVVSKCNFKYINIYIGNLTCLPEAYLHVSVFSNMLICMYIPTMKLGHSMDLIIV